MSKVRIQKALAEAGVASRRSIEQMVLEGRISVNGQLVTRLPFFVDPAGDDIRVDGRKLSRRPAERVYILLNKPRGVVCSQADPQGRPRALDLIPPTRQRLYCVGRLDVESTGLILLTNDGELTQHLTHASGGVSKLYVAEVDGKLTVEEIDKLRRGFYVAGKRTAGVGVKVLRGGAERSLLELRVLEGRGMDVRRAMAELGHKVRRLKRVAIGTLTDRGLKIGSFRHLTGGEVERLRHAGPQGDSPRPRRGAPRKT